MRVSPLYWCVWLLVVACATPGPTAVSGLDGIVGSWVLVGDAAAGGRQPTMTIGADGAVHGNGGINRYLGAIDPLAFADQRWACGGLSMTEMAGSMPAMEAERRFLSALVGADRARLDGGQLALLRGEEVLVRFERLRMR